MVLQLNKDQSKAIDIVEKLIEVDYNLVDLFIPLVFNYDGVADYIIANYSDVLEEPESRI